MALNPRGQSLIDWHCDPADLPLQPLIPTGGPLSPDPKRPPRHHFECSCDSCLDMVASMERYQQSKRDQF